MILIFGYLFLILLTKACSFTTAIDSPSSTLKSMILFLSAKVIITKDNSKNGSVNFMLFLLCLVGVEKESMSHFSCFIASNEPLQL